MVIRLRRGEILLPWADNTVYALLLNARYRLTKLQIKTIWFLIKTTIALHVYMLDSMMPHGRHFLEATPWVRDYKTVSFGLRWLLSSYPLVKPIRRQGDSILTLLSVEWMNRDFWQVYMAKISITWALFLKIWGLTSSCELRQLSYGKGNALLPSAQRWWQRCTWIW